MAHHRQFIIHKTTPLNGTYVLYVHKIREFPGLEGLKLVIGASCEALFYSAVSFYITSVRRYITLVRPYITPVRFYIILVRHYFTRL